MSPERVARERDRKRIAKYGATPEDVARLLREQTGPDGVARCPISGAVVTEKSALDHAWDMRAPDTWRGIVKHQVNAVLPNTDDGLHQFAQNLVVYSNRRQRLKLSRVCAAPSKRKLTKRKLAAVRAAVRKVARS
jgi:hypothetical protein